MPITPHFTLHQTLSHVELDIRVPHVRVTPESIQVVLDCENAILHFASPPYLLILNFAALCDTTCTDDDIDGHGGGNYRFHEAASEACATYEPTIENGMIHLSLKKAAHAQTMWNNLHLLGRMVLPSRSNNKQKVYNNNNIINGNSNSNNMKNSTSQWLLEEIASSTTTTKTTATTDTRDVSAAITNSMREDQKDEAEEEEDVMGRQTSTMKRRHHHGYGFGGMFDGVFSDLTRDGLAKEMLESPPDDFENNNNELLNIDMDNDDNDDDESGNITIASSSSSASYALRRRLQRRRMENSKFDPDRYRQDLDDDLDDDYIYQCAMAMKPHWVITPSSGVGGGDGGGCDSNDFKETVVVTKRLDSLTVNQECGSGMDGSPQPPSDGGNAQQQQQRQESYYFTEEERLQLVSIPYPLLSPETSLSRRLQRQQQQQRRQNGNHRDSDNGMEENDLTLGIVVGLVDLLFAYVYDHLTTDGDATVESAWTVSILSASLSWMEDWQHLTTSATTTTTTTTTRSNQDDDLDILSAAAVKEVLYSSLRRALVYPYLRNLGFALHCARQVADILTQGPCCILRCLLQTRQVLNHSELYYMGNKLFIDPYLAWIQQQNCNLLSRRLADMAHVIRNLVLSFANFASTEQCKQSLGLDLMHMEQEEEMEDHEHDGQRSSSASDSNDDNSSSSEESQSNDDDAEKQSPESDHKEQWESVKDTAVSSELLDCSLGFSALHIVKPHDSTFMSPSIITDQNPTELPTSECTKQQQQHQLSLSSKPTKLIVGAG